MLGGKGEYFTGLLVLHIQAVTVRLGIALHRLHAQLVGRDQVDRAMVFEQCDIRMGPILNRYLGMAGGAEVVSSAFAMTALVFGGLSAYVLITRKDMSFLGGFITAGFFVLLAAVVAGMFFQISGLQLAISAGFVLFSSVCILFQCSTTLKK